MTDFLATARFKARDMNGSSCCLYMEPFDCGERFVFSIRDGKESIARVDVSAKDSWQLQNDIRLCLAPPSKSEPKDLAERLIQITELIAKEPEGSRLALASFVAGYFGFRIAP